MLVAGLVLDASTTGLVVACAYLLTAPLGIVTAGPRARIFGDERRRPAPPPDAVGVPAGPGRRRERPLRPAGASGTEACD